MTDLLDLLRDLDATPGRIHALMPWMGLACGLEYLDMPKSEKATTGPYTAVTCPGCLAAGDLHQLAAAAQGRQAPVTE